MRASTVEFIRRAIAFVFKPLTASHNWWFGFRLWTGTVYAVCPDTMVILFVLYAPAFIVAPLSLAFWPHVLAFALAGPFAFWQVLRIRNGVVVRVRTLLGIPYWFTPVMHGSRFEVFQAWEDDRPSSVAFCLGDTEVHFGSSGTAYAIHSAISSELEDQGWTSRDGRGFTFSPKVAPPPERLEPTL